jgi:hypothetical protein
MTRFPVRLAGVAFVWLTLCAQAPTVPPSAGYDAQLPDGAHLHMLAIPFGRLDGTIVGRATFDASGERAAFLATFPGATLTGDWRSLDPVQAFVLDASRRTMTQLTIDGQARAIAWVNDQTISVQDGSRRNQFAVMPALGVPLPPLRMAAGGDAGATIVAQGGDGRFFVAKTLEGRYLVLQIGARTLRDRGTAKNGAFALVGGFLAWVDRSARAGAPIARRGAQDVAPPSFAGSAYGDALGPIAPLGRVVYQGAYRNGFAYFGFTYGVRRIVARTSDFLSYSFPSVPNDLSYTVGDGFGAGAGDQLYFARPESSDLSYWRQGKYVHVTLEVPDEQGGETDLEYAMRRLAPADPLWPPLRPDEDALDAAMLQWRVYPIGDDVGDAWIASYLGRLLLGDAKGRFRFAGTPQYPFAVLGRTDDGRIWGASPTLRLFAGTAFAEATSNLWWTRDGVAWLQAATIPGDAGAVGLDHRRVWVAYTHPWLGRAEIWLERLGDTSGAATGGTYAGEQLFFASLPNGFWLVWGATPGWRLNGDEGPLSAYRIDQSALFSSLAGMGNVFQQQWLDPKSDPSLPAAVFDVHDAAALAQPTLDAIAALPSSTHVLFATNLDGLTVDTSKITLLGLDQARAFAVKYAGWPYPLVTVRATVSGDAALVERSFASGTLTRSGSRERWSRANGQWERVSTQPF